MSSKRVLCCIPANRFRVIHRSLLFEAVEGQKRPLLTEVLDTLKAAEETDQDTEDSKGSEHENREENADPEKVSEIVAVLEKLEEVHLAHHERLTEANKEIKNPEVTKVCNMQEKISYVKESLGTAKKKEQHLIDQPNSEGDTLLHLTTNMDDDEVTRLLLNHGANPNVQDSSGNSPLHTICLQRDIQTATCILNNQGALLMNKALQMPSIEELFFDQRGEEVRELMESIDRSKHRKEILDKILRKEHILFKLVAEDKAEILSLVLKKLTKSDREDYVNLVRDEKDGNTAIHLSSLINKSLECTSLLLEAGAKLKTNEDGLTPTIEEFFTEENRDKITTSLVDGVVERVKTNQLNQKQALKLLIPEDKREKILFQLARRSNWGLIADWADEQGISFSEILPRLTANEIEKMVEVGKEEIWPKDGVHALLCEEDHETGTVLFSRLQIDKQTEVAAWNQRRTIQIAHRLSADFIHWLIKEASEGSWSKEVVGGIVCKRNSDNQLILATLDFNTQQEVAFWNPEAVSRIAHLVGDQFSQWLFMQAKEGKWNEEEVDNILLREHETGSIPLSALDFETQKEVANKKKQRTNEVAHLMSAEFCQWLIQMADEGKWSKEAVGDIMCRKNAENQLILGTLDEETQKRVAEFNKLSTCGILCDMDKGDFLSWLYHEAENGRWDRAMVFSTLKRENIDGEFVILAEQPMDRG